MLKIFLDTEFTGLTQHTVLIAIALVVDVGHYFYAENTAFNLSNVEDEQQRAWLETNVIANLGQVPYSNDLKKMSIQGNPQQIAMALQIWLEQFGIKKDESGNIVPNIQVWADVPHYDWVLFCELFEGALKIPKQIHWKCVDLYSYLEGRGIKTNSIDDLATVAKSVNTTLFRHNALHDAIYGLKVYEKYGQ
ncbi:MAG: 3'-5' exoribonuclease [Chitinophagales bacterium]|nr:3'-5' exoribonuclease [Chitinophagales bacterium]